MLTRTISSFLLVLLGSQLSRPAVAAFIIDDFAAGAPLHMILDASLVDGDLWLTEAIGLELGAAWHTEKQAIASGFDTIFLFRMRDPVNGGSDGLAFVVQNAAADAIGINSGFQHYEGIPNSLAIDFDTYDNVDEPPSGNNHISIQTNGTGPNMASPAFMLAWTPSIPDLNDGQTHIARIRYQSGVLTVWIDSPDPMLSVAVDFDTLLDLDQGRAWVGFTAGTGGGAESHEILGWCFTDLFCDGFETGGTHLWSTTVP